jgi:amino acid transporter
VLSTSFNRRTCKTGSFVTRAESEETGEISEFFREFFSLLGEVGVCEEGKNFSFRGVSVCGIAPGEIRIFCGDSMRGDLLFDTAFGLTGSFSEGTDGLVGVVTVAVVVAALVLVGIGVAVVLASVVAVVVVAAVAAVVVMLIEYIFSPTSLDK